MDKSQFNSSVEDTQSFDIYETHNPQAAAMVSSHSFYFAVVDRVLTPLHRHKNVTLT